MDKPRRLSGAERTREALIHAGLRLFGSHGFEATSTRALASEAGANIGSIAYHFGGKDGLHAACAEYIVDMISLVAEGAFGEIAAPREDVGPEEARAQLAQTLDAMVSFIVARPEAGEIVQFVLRELTHPTGALDTIYTGVFEPVHMRLCALWAAATGEPAESENTKITVFTMIGQVVYFRIAREPVMRRMGWKTIGARESSKVVYIASSNLKAILDSRRRTS
ncbi:CerR family C-terminal domain-containing protein [Chelativorans sp. YIM 93263]|uniref:CerR family C-terminal domain-containing protein n=1 Tax=Chelativorans sp. YIM 93263 TaxID=2906648 RepID=UPI0023785C72|nr:CerR family C-terminal domain-containing protein [Chelativorans sp. YIM 93263]